MPGENAVSPEGVAALPEPAVGVEYPSSEAAKVAVFRAFLAQQAEPVCRSNWQTHTIACRLHTGATPLSLGNGSCCTFMYKYEALELGLDPVKITVANLVHSCPDGVRKARFSSRAPKLGQDYVRKKLFAAELDYQSQQKERPGEVKPALGNEAAIDAANPSTSSSASSPVANAREPKPIATETPSEGPEASTATRYKDDERVAADATETGNLRPPPLLKSTSPANLPRSSLERA